MAASTATVGHTHDDMGASILEPGRNCWRKAHAARLAFLIDGQAYFSAFRAAVAEARRSILILAWDVDSRMELVRDGEADDGLPTRLGAFLNEVVARRPGLHAHVLSWDFAVIYALEREWLPLYKLGWRTHRRLDFRLDGRHPPGASQHQKVVVVDDAVAFVGGFDLTKRRWDTSEHRPNDPRRVDPDGTPYSPFHDVQVMVEGEAAAALGELVRWRWQRVTGKRIADAEPPDASPWPRHVVPDLENVPVGIARTHPALDGLPAVQEVQRSYLDALAAARRFIYCEAQYLTSSVIGEALAQRLSEADGPEVVLVVPKRTRGWLEQTTMDVLRARLLKKLLAADRFGRLRLYCPDQAGLDPECINVHAKVMVVDDRLARVGSSNLSNRSMGLDTECDLILEAAGDERIAHAIAGFRDRLLAEHLGAEPERVAAEIAQRGSLIGAIDALNGGERSLVALERKISPALLEVLPEADVIDPERPIAAERLAAQLVPPEHQQPISGRALRFGLLLLGVLGLAAAWQWTPLGDWLSTANITAGVEVVRNSPFAPFAAIGLFVVGGLLVMPVTLLIVVIAAVFGPILGFVYASIGTVLSAAVVYGVGHYLGRDFVRRLAGKKVNRLSQALAKRGILTIITVRVLPIAPFSVINLVAGASHIRFRDYLIGTVLGMTPGLLLLTVFVDQLQSAVREPGMASIIVAVIVVVMVVSILGFRHWAARRKQDKDAGA